MHPRFPSPTCGPVGPPQRPICRGCADSRRLGPGFTDSLPRVGWDLWLEGSSQVHGPLGWVWESWDPSLGSGLRHRPTVFGPGLEREPPLAESLPTCPPLLASSVGTPEPLGARSVGAGVVAGSGVPSLDSRCGLGLRRETEGWRCQVLGRGRKMPAAGKDQAGNEVCF